MEHWLQISLQYDLHFPFYYGRPSSGWPTAIVKCAWCLDLCSRRLLSPNLLANRHQTCLHVRR